MPHYWFRVPLDGTADHLKRAKQTGGAPKVRHELKMDAHGRGKEIPNALFAAGLEFVDVDVFSAERMSAADCNWFHERWETGESGCPEETLDADETVLEPGSGWIRDPGTSD